jgi:hypothetical protein
MDVFNRRTILSFALGIVVGVLGLAIYAMVAGSARLEPARVEVHEGVTNGVNMPGNAIGFTAADGAVEDEGYVLSGASWSDSRDNLWHEPFDSGEGPSRVTPLSKGQRLRLGIVNVPASEGAAGRPHVRRFECLGEPSEVDGS